MTSSLNFNMFKMFWFHSIYVWELLILKLLPFGGFLANFDLNGLNQRP
jgi:hypothetical protein